MVEPTYRQALSQAWHLAWHNKVLWIFGLLSVFLGQFGLNDFLGKLFFSREGTFFPMLHLSSKYFSTGWNSFWSGWLALIAMLLCIFVVVAAVIAQGALVSVAAEWFKRGKVLHLGKAWHKGAKHFWQLFSITVLRKCALVLVIGFVAFFLSRVPVAPTGGATFLSVLIVTVGLFLALWFSTVATFAVGYVVEGGETLSVALVKGARLFHNHVLVSLELSVLLLIINIFVVFAIVALATWVLIPSFLFSLLATATGYTPLIAFGLGFSVMLFIVLVAFIGAIYNAFTTSAWIYLFMKMHHEGVVSRLLHWVRNFKR